jgi:hypothetical protein
MSNPVEENRYFGETEFVVLTALIMTDFIVEI